MSILLFVASIAVTLVLYSMGLPFFFVFLFIPLIPFFGARKSVKRCPVCGYETSSDRIAFCPYDGTPLHPAGGENGEGHH